MNPRKRSSTCLLFITFIFLIICKPGFPESTTLDKTLAVVDTELIWQSDIELMFAMDNAFKAELESDALDKERRRALLDEAIFIRLAHRYLIRIGRIDPNVQAQVETFWNTFKNGIESQGKTTVNEMAARYGRSEEAFKGFFVDRLLAEQFRQDLIKRDKLDTWIQDQKKRVAVEKL